jgi:hypothetical protein
MQRSKKVLQVRMIIQQGQIETKMDREKPKLRFHYITLRVVCVKQRCKSNIFTPHKEQSILT